MKFSATLVLAALPFLTSIAASPLVADGNGRLVARQQRGGNQRGGRNRGGQNNNNNGNNGAAAGGAAAGGAAAGGAAAGANNGANQGNNGANQGNNAGNGAAAGNNGNNGNNGANNGNNGANNGGGNQDPQVSTTLDPKVIAAGFAKTGQEVPADGQVASLTSTNNFINFCLTVPDKKITDGKQLTEGSCNPAPIGVIPNVDRQPSSKFTSPKNGDTIQADKQFVVSMAIKNLQAGNFVNAQSNYFAAPQQLNGQGIIVGHTHVVIQKIPSLDSTEVPDPKVFQFFKGVNGAAQGGIVTADVTAGVPAGTYRMCSINTSANHAPCIGPVAQHGSFDDCVYFTANANGQAAAAGGNNGAAAGGNNGANQGNNGANQGNNGAAAGNNGAAAGNNGANQGNNGANQGNNGANQGNNGAAAGNNGAAAGNNGAAAGNNGAAAGNNGAAAGNNGAAAGNNGAAAGNNGGAAAGGAAAGNNGQQQGQQQQGGRRGGRRGGRQN